MRGRFLLLLLLSALGSNGSSKPPDPKAFLRFGQGKYYVAVVPDPPLRSGAASSDILAGVYKDGQLVTDVVSAPDAYGSSFTLEIPADASLGDDISELSLTVLRYPAGNGRGSFSVKVKTEVSAQIDANNPGCAPELALELASDPKQDSPSPYAAARFASLNSYLHEHEPAAQVESRTRKGTETRAVELGQALALPTVISQCFGLVPAAPSGAYDLKLTFASGAPIELRPFLLKTDLVRSAASKAPLALDDADVGVRRLERSLDAGVQFGSSVEDQPDGRRKRTDKGSLDLRLAPLLNLLPAPAPGSTSLWFLTPFFVDARVSTGKIDTDTLSQNRIVFGTEAELRHYSDPGTYPTYQRFIFGIKNASDRDFHQAEWKGTAEFQPVFSALNRPLRWGGRTEASQLDPDPDREPKHILSGRRFGWQVLPTFGLELGRTWRNRDLPASIEQSQTVKRFYFGGTINLDVTRYVSLSGQDLLYVRGEAPADRVHNYLLTSLNIPLPNFTTNVAESVFFSYERGAQPPFATPDTNALKIGFRIQSEGWFGKQR